MRGQAPPADSRLSESHYRPMLSDANFAKLEALTRWGVERGRSILEIALSYLGSQRVVASVIAGATRPEQVTQNVRLTRSDLSETEIARIRHLVSPHGGTH